MFVHLGKRLGLGGSFRNHFRFYSVKYTLSAPKTLGLISNSKSQRPGLGTICNVNDKGLTLTIFGDVLYQELFIFLLLIFD